MQRCGLGAYQFDPGEIEYDEKVNRQSLADSVSTAR